MVGGGDVAEDPRPWIGQAVGPERLEKDDLPEFARREFENFCEKKEIFLGRIELKLDSDRRNFDRAGVVFVGMQRELEDPSQLR